IGGWRSLQDRPEESVDDLLVRPALLQDDVDVAPEAVVPAFDEFLIFAKLRGIVEGDAATAGRRLRGAGLPLVAAEGLDLLEQAIELLLQLAQSAIAVVGPGRWGGRGRGGLPGRLLQGGQAASGLVQADLRLAQLGRLRGELRTGDLHLDLDLLRLVIGD